MHILIMNIIKLKKWSGQSWTSQTGSYAYVSAMEHLQKSQASSTMLLLQLTAPRVFILLLATKK